MFFCQVVVPIKIKVKLYDVLRYALQNWNAWLCLSYITPNAWCCVTHLTKPITLRDTSHRTLTHVTCQGQEKPVPCEGGTFQEQTGETDCIPCPAGKFCNPEPGACVLYLIFPLISLHLILFLTFIKYCCPHDGDDHLMLFQNWLTFCNLLL